MGNPHQLECIPDGLQGVFNGKGRCMVVDDECDSVFGAIECRSQSAGPDHFQIQVLIQVPPDRLQNFLEVLWRFGRCRHASGKGRVNMMVTASERSCHQFSAAIQNRITGLRIQIERKGINHGYGSAVTGRNR